MSMIVQIMDNENWEDKILQGNEIDVKFPSPKNNELAWSLVDAMMFG